MRERKQVLVVEDDIAIGEMLQMLLDLEGFDVRWEQTAASASRLLEACGDVPERSCAEIALPTNTLPDLILLDLQLPDADGAEMIKGLRSSGNRVPPIVIVSARRTAAIERAAAEIDAAGMIFKPFPIEDLLAQIRAALS